MNSTQKVNKLTNSGELRCKYKINFKFILKNQKSIETSLFYLKFACRKIIKNFLNQLHGFKIK